MEKIKRMEYVALYIVIITLLIMSALGEREPVKGNEEEITTIQKESTTSEGANIETVTVETVAVTEVTTEQVTQKVCVELYDVPLEAELQYYIIELCESAHISSALVMAIIERESDFNALEVGDDGDSLGLMQIQPKWHQWRMDKLGGSDWFNPYDNVTVGVHILTELFHKYGDDVYMVLMAYNGGCAYAERMSEQGEYSNYAIEVDARSEALEHMKEDI